MCRIKCERFRLRERGEANVACLQQRQPALVRDLRIAGREGLRAAIELHRRLHLAGFERRPCLLQDGNQLVHDRPD